jgi:hypothetical protein
LNRARIIVLAVGAVLVASLFPLLPAGATHGGDREVTVGSNDNLFSQNKQNEPALAVDPVHTNVLVAGANDNIDMEGCNAGDDTNCPFTAGVGASGVSFSFNSGDTWFQPAYKGYSARVGVNNSCIGVNDPAGATPEPCVPKTPDQGGVIGTLPWYYEDGLISDGDPAVAFGPRPDASGNFSWANGPRLYYANLTSNFASKRREFGFKGIEGIGVSRLDGPNDGSAFTQTWVADRNHWKHPVMIPNTSGASFADKEQVWADNASDTSPFFGNAYVCYANYKGGPSAGSARNVLIVARSTDGGSSWTQTVVVQKSYSSSGLPHFLESGIAGCTLRTDSEGNVYAFWTGYNQNTRQQSIQMSVSSDGGVTWTTARKLFRSVGVGVLDPVIFRKVEDGVAGARDDLANAPSVDIANGAPTGADATDQIVLTWVDGRDGLNNEHVLFTTSTDGGGTWTPGLYPFTKIEEAAGVNHPGDRGYYTAPAISPDGTDVYVVYNAYTTPYDTDTTGARTLLAEVVHANINAITGAVGAFSQIHRSTPGDPRGSSQNDRQAEFLGDYVYAVATRTFGAAVWNDVRNASDCPAIDAWRMSLRTGATVPLPEPVQNCPSTFGGSSIYGGSWADPS